MNLERALALLKEAGQLVTAEAMESDSQESDSFFEAVAGLVLAKKALTKIINGREITNGECTVSATNSGEVSTNGGVAGWNEGAGDLSGSAQAHGAESPE